MSGNGQCRFGHFLGIDKWLVNDANLETSVESRERCITSDETEEKEMNRRCLLSFIQHNNALVYTKST